MQANINILLDFSVEILKWHCAYKETKVMAVFFKKD